jgi:hypothetical protein
MTDTEALRTALLQADPKLSKYNPLSRILCFDDFDDGVNGWTELVGNHDGNLDNIQPDRRDFRPPQISNLTFFDMGSHGAMSGNYALKVATRPKPFHMAVAAKRLTWAGMGRVQLETYLTFKAEATFGRESRGGRAYDGNYHPSEADFGSFTLSNDVSESPSGPRYHCVLRYVNTDHEGNLVQKWYSATSSSPSTKALVAGEVLSVPDFHVRNPDDWREIPDSYMPMCYNEVPTKVNWHYIRWQWDLKTRRNVELQINDTVLDLRDVPVPVYPDPYWGLNRLLNFALDVRTHTDVRNFLYMDSILISADW